MSAAIRNDPARRSAHCPPPARIAGISAAIRSDPARRGTGRARSWCAGPWGILTFVQFLLLFELQASCAVVQRRRLAFACAAMPRSTNGTSTA